MQSRTRDGIPVGYIRSCMVKEEQGTYGEKQILEG